MSKTSAYIIAARRTALGRIGGLHRNRRIAELAAPVVRAALEDCGLAPERVDELIAGNATEGGNPARLIALAAGLSDTAAAATIDRQCASGLDAILAAIRAIGAGEADVIVAGGGEAISTAPWRIAKPKSLYQLPHFMALEPTPPSIALRGAAALRGLRGDTTAQARYQPRPPGRLCAPLAPAGRGRALGAPLRRRDRAAARQRRRGARPERGRAGARGARAADPLRAARRHADARQHQRACTTVRRSSSSSRSASGSSSESRAR